MPYQSLPFYSRYRYEDIKPTSRILFPRGSLRSKYHPNIDYIHVIEPRVNGTGFDRNEGSSLLQMENDFIPVIWAPKPLISAGGHERVTAVTVTDEIIAFGRHFLANPDLVHTSERTRIDRFSMYQGTLARDTWTIFLCRGRVTSKVPAVENRDVMFFRSVAKLSARTMPCISVQLSSYGHNNMMSSKYKNFRGITLDCRTQIARLAIVIYINLAPLINIFVQKNHYPVLAPE
ncbi:hypothetical protein EDD85DRAFT_821327 [Armillaria nabsnona]|nr:hypothetical protein EDD85DRAFT_821327 [Armillaria nabsnona]